jgi:CheY-like chemotaxis protein
MDIRMPVMDGPTALAHIIERYGDRGPNVVAVTASVFDHQRRGFLDQGFDGFLDKPLRAEQIFRYLEDQLGVEYVFTDTEQLAPAQRTLDWRGIKLSPDLHNSILVAAEASAITELRDLLDRLVDEAPAWAAHLSELTQQFDITGIQAVMEEIKPL